jgi:hypothetical protein
MLFNKSKEKGSKEDLLQRLFIIYSLDIFVFILLMALFESFVSLQKIEVLYASIGLLTFIGLFYSLIFQSKTNLENVKKMINDYISEANKEFEANKNKLDASKLGELKRKIKAHETELRNVKFLRLMVQVDKILYICILIMISTIYSYIAGEFTSANILFLISLSLVFHIISVWAFIFQEKYEVKPKVSWFFG